MDVSVIERANVFGTYAVTSSSTTTTPIPYHGFASGEVLIPAGSTVTTLTWWASHDGVTYYAAQDSAGSAVTQTVAASKAYPIPVALLGARFLKCVTNASDTLSLCLKA